MEENNKILRGIRRANRIGVVWRILYWLVIIGLSVGAYVYIQPYLDRIMKTYQNIEGTASSMQSSGNSLSNFFKSFNK